MLRLLLLLLMTGPSFATDDPRFQPAQQADNGEWQNSQPVDDHGLPGFLKWQWQTLGQNLQQSWQATPLPIVDTDTQALRDNRSNSTLTWIGHSSFLIQHAGFNILTDPIFSERCSPVQWAGPKRLTATPFALAELPPIDAVVISHSHYDHLDYDSVKALQEHSQPRFYVPMGLAEWFVKHGIDNVVELNWWQHHAQADWLFTAVPAQHFSGRTATDRNQTLWAGWVMQHDGRKFYFAGDTGYSKDFKHIGDYFGGVDLALIPIGAYDPRWFMQPMHINPEEAVQIHLDVGAKQSIGMHWGTFKLTDEPWLEPAERLRELATTSRLQNTTFKTIKHGETLNLGF